MAATALLLTMHLAVSNPGMQEENKTKDGTQNDTLRWRNRHGNAGYLRIYSYSAGLPTG
jgi:hypothetical protein